jgi:hypothetical protein
MGNQNRPWQAREEVLSYFDQREGIARRKYRQFVLEGIPQGGREELRTGGLKRNREELSEEPQRKSDTRILGGDEFLEKMLAEQERVTQRRALFKKKKVGVEELMDRVVRRFGVTREEMVGGSQR